MSFIENIKLRAKQNIKTICLPEAEDIRTLEATQMVLNEGYAKIILIGNEENIKKVANENNINIEGAKIIDPKTSEKTKEYAEKLYELRKAKQMTLEKASELCQDPTHYGMMMLKENEADRACFRSGTLYC